MSGSVMPTSGSPEVLIRALWVVLFMVWATNKYLGVDCSSIDGGKMQHLEILKNKANMGMLAEAVSQRRKHDVFLPLIGFNF